MNFWINNLTIINKILFIFRNLFILNIILNLLKILSSLFLGFINIDIFLDIFDHYYMIVVLNLI